MDIYVPPIVRKRAQAALELRRRKKKLVDKLSPFQEWIREPTVTIPSWTWSYDTPHAKAWMDLLDLVTDGVIDYLMLFGPPRHFKTEIMSVRYTVYRMERH